MDDIPYHQVPDGTTVQTRLVERVRTLFLKNLTTFLPFGELNTLALKYEDYKLALTDELLQRVFGNAKLTQPLRDDLDDSIVSGYISGQDLADRFPDEETDGEYWIRSGTAGFSIDAADHFYMPERYTDPFDNETTLEFNQNYDLRGGPV